MKVDPRVFAIAADILETRGLCKTHQHGTLVPKSMGGPKTTISTTGAILVAIRTREMELGAPGNSARQSFYLVAFREYCGVNTVMDLEAGKATCEEIVEQLRMAAQEL